jgi:predicted acyl esterase
MRRPSWASRPVIIAVVVVLAAGIAVGLVLAGGGSGRKSRAGSDVMEHIPVGAGVTLSAEVITPRGNAPFPLVVMPASWGSGPEEYRVLGRSFAAAGYQVVAYAQRGFRKSGGVIDFAGTDTQRDVSRVIDWALANTSADARHIGVLGVSYGGGTALLAAARDSRIKAVAALSTWADYAAAFIPHGTPNVQSLHSLFDAAAKYGRLDAELSSVARALDQSPQAAAAQLQKLSAERSATRVVSELNRNKPAIFLANAYEDSVIDPSQLVPFFSKLTTPKRLQLAVGEHTGPELPGLFARPDATMLAATQWLDHFLRGKRNSAQSTGPIVLQDGASTALHAYAQWPANTHVVQLAAPGAPNNIVTSETTAWSRRLTSGTDSPATSGQAFIAAPASYRPTTVATNTLAGSDACVWSAPPVGTPLRISGSPELRLRVASPARNVTLYAYLYDVDSTGTGTLMSYAPATVASGSATMAFRPMSWTVAQGHRVEVVVDTVDARYAAAEPAGTDVTLSSPASLSFATG